MLGFANCLYVISEQRFRTTITTLTPTRDRLYVSGWWLGETSLLYDPLRCLTGLSEVKKKCVWQTQSLL